MGRPRAIVTRFADQITLRLPEGMRDELNRVAAENGRSANTEIVLRLQQSLKASADTDLAALREHLDRRLDELAALIEGKK